MSERTLAQQRVLIYDPDRCSGCMYCMVICSFEHYGVCSFDRTSIWIAENPGQKGAFIAAHCAHCEYPMCEAVCPSDAIVKDEETGIVRISSMKCIGCKNCIIACPISVPWFDLEHRVAIKCDLCDGDPECVKFCPTGALKVVPRVEARERYGILKGNGGIRRVSKRG